MRPGRADYQKRRRAGRRRCRSNDLKYLLSHRRVSGALNLAVGLWSLRIKWRHFAPLRLCALARMSLLIQAVVLAKTQRSQREDPGYGWAKFSKTINPRLNSGAANATKN